MRELPTDSSLEETIDPRAEHLDEKEIRALVEPFIERRRIFLDAVGANGSPLYLLDTSAILDRLERFRRAFHSVLPDAGIFYALKSNSHPHLISTLVKNGCGIDVSSGCELETALAAGADRIIFSGPGKTDEELAAAVRYADRVTVLIDSFGELERLQRAVKSEGRPLRAGIRVTTEEHGLWRKFGIPLARLGEFLFRSPSDDLLSVEGIQFHTSWNLTPASQVRFIQKLGDTLAGFPDELRRRIKFIDIGGGYWPEPGEWLQHPPAGKWDKCEPTQAGAHAPGRVPPRYRLRSEPIETFASAIGTAFREHVFPHLGCRVLLEPGRWLSHNAMHLLLKVVDVKSPDLVITDGGTNAVGWERFEHDYFPVINLTQPGLTEHPCLVLGSLCTPHDVWGFSYHGYGIAEGDVLLVPDQGAYTYSLRQKFIKPLPGTAILGVHDG